MSAALNAREIDIAALVARGYCNKQIAAELGVSEQNVKNRLVRIFRKAGVCSRTTLALWVLRNPFEVAA